MFKGKRLNSDFKFYSGLLIPLFVNEINFMEGRDIYSEYNSACIGAETVIPLLLTCP